MLNLFDDVVFTGIVEHVEPTSSGYSLWGRLDGVELGTMTLVVNGSVVAGTVRTPEAVYTIRTAGAGAYVIRQIDESLLPPLGEPLRGPLPAPDARAQAANDPPDDGSEIDVMVVYTPLAKHQEGSRAAIEALIDLFVAETNQANANSGVTHRIRLVLREEVEYTEDGNSFIDLRRLRDDTDGYMDHVHELRDLYAADLVHIVVGRSVNVCGVASTEFALTASYCGGLVFAHELGHNMGLSHDRYVVANPGRRSNFGYVNQRMFDEGAPESARWRTIMAYVDQCWEVLGDVDCPRVAYFSNPDKTYNGDPMGVPTDHPSTGVDGPADAVGTLNDRREIIANYRRSSTSPTPRVHLTLSPYWLSETGGVSTVTATLHRPSSADTMVTLSASPADAVTLSANRTLTILAGQTVSAGAVTITGVDNGDQTGDVSVTVSGAAANTGSLGVIAPEPVALAIADDETTPVVTLSLSPAEVFEGGGWDGGRTFVTATLDNRSSAETIVTVSASPAEAIEEIWDNTLTILAGQTASGWPVWIHAVDDIEFAEAKKSVTVSGSATNPQGVTGPESVTLTIIDDDAPVFADDSIAHTFTAGVTATRVLPEAEYGNGTLTYSISPAPGNGVTFTPGPPARIGVSTTSTAASETSYTLTATDADGDTDTMTVSITVRKPVCADSAAVSGYTAPELVADCEALLASRDTLRGDQSLNWSEHLSIDNWQGVEIADNRVVGMDLSDLDLTGTIPSELGNLAKLQSLDLGDNELTGEIPAELVSLAKLQSLNLGWNELTGEIPTELGNLAKLQSLHLNWNELTGEIPAELGGLANLQSLHLSGNELTGEMPAELGNLANLQSLNLDGNELTGEIPAELGGLSNLQSLNLVGNELTGEIPTELGNLANLQELNLGWNQLTGEIPAELGSLSNLEWLELSRNQLTGPVPVEVGSLANLRELDLSRNQLTGPIPAEVGSLANLRELDLSSNQLTGPIPAEIGSLSNLQWLNLGANQLTGKIPSELGNLSNMVVLDLSDNQLSGPIPSELGRLANLRSLVLSENQLEEEIPTELGNLRYLEELYLGGNQLTGCIPARLRHVTNNDLDQLSLPFCEAPQDACTTGGAVADATNNGLVSDCEALLAAQYTLAESRSLNWSANTPITEWDGITVGGTPQRVTALELNDWGLTGTVPTELGSLSNLEVLALYQNQLTGEIPDWLGSLSNLQSLHLGLIPSER